jgi:hypothetical protein
MDYTIKEANFEIDGKCYMYLINNLNFNIFRIIVENDGIYNNTKSENKKVDVGVLDFIIYDILKYSSKWEWGSFVDDLYYILSNDKSLVDKLIHPKEYEEYDESVEVTFTSSNGVKLTYTKSVKNGKQINLRQDLLDVVYSAMELK